MKARLATIAALLITTSCAAFWRDAKTVLTITEAACALAHAEQFDQTVEVAHVCGIADALIPALQELLSAAKIAAKQKRAERACP